jgi:hypothetical protein
MGDSINNTMNVNNISNILDIPLYEYHIIV